MDRHGPDGALKIKAMAYGLMVFGLSFAAIMMRMGPSPLAFAVAAVASSAASWLAWVIAGGAGAAFQAFIQPSGNSTPYEAQFSYQEALIMKGDIAGALESYEAIIAENPMAVSPRMRAAEHYLAKERDVARAAALFREIREIPGVSSRDAVYASTRLVDLYEGPLANPGRALVEMRRIIELYPGTPMAKHAREALPRMKALVDAASGNQL